MTARAKFWKSEQDAVNRLVPVDASLTGVDISTGLGSNHSWNPYHNSNKVDYCKGASLLTSGTQGVLAVHLVNDPDGVWYLMDLTPGAQPLGAEFDLVGDNTVGTTVTLDSQLYIYPAAYVFAANSGQN